MSAADIGPSEALARLFTPEGKDDPYPLYDALRPLGPVAQLGPRTALVLGYHELAAALREPGLLVTDAAFHRETGMIQHTSWRCLTRIMMFSNGADHARLRHFARDVFSAKHVEALRPVVERAARSAAAQLAETAPRELPVDLVEAFSFTLPMAVVGELLGVPEQDRAGLRGPVAACTTAFEPISDLADLAAGDAGMDRLMQYVTGLVAARRQVPGGDLCSDLIRRCDEEGTVDDEELVALLVLLLIAGSQTPSDLIGNALSAALAHPTSASGLGSDDTASRAFVAETLRWDPPVQALTRVAARDLQLCGTPVKEGGRLLLLIGAANRDPRQFEAPDRFDPGRAGPPPIAFGLGQHYCLGAAFARMEAEIAVPAFLRQFPLASRAGAPSYRDQLVQRGFAAFPCWLHGEPAQIAEQ